MKVVPLSYPILLNAQKTLRFMKEERMKELLKKIIHQKKVKSFTNRSRR